MRRLEYALRQIEALIATLPRSLWSPELQAEWDELVEDSARTLLELHEMGLVRIYWAADGGIAAEVLDRVLH